jgi:peptidoglycan/xylan/chitin deacetylase (PgdA/CDA1 family)
MRLPGRKAVSRSLRWVRSRLRRGVLVLGYHRISDGADPFDIAVPARHFAEHLDVIAKIAHPMRLPDGIRAVTEDRVPRRAVVLTFDDGYHDTFTSALPLLERRGIPATVFVTTGYPGSEFWWDELARIADTIGPARLERELRGRWTHASRSATAVDSRAVTLSIADELRVLPTSEREAAMNVIRGWAEPRPNRCNGVHRALTAREIQCLASSPCIELGAHTVHHPILTNLSPEEQLREISQSRISLQTITGADVESFSYPHGAYSASTIAAVQMAGFTAACCSTPDVVSPRSNIFALPRMWVGSSDGRSFERWLRRWSTG